MSASGPAVTAVQIALRNAGHELQADGDFRTITLAAIKAFDAARGLPRDGLLDAATAVALDKVAPPPSVLKVAPWLARALTGTKDVPGSKDNTLIVNMAHEITRRFPDLAVDRHTIDDEQAGPPRRHGRRH